MSPSVLACAVCSGARVPTLAELQVDNDGSVSDVSGTWQLTRTGVATTLHNGPLQMVPGPDGETLDGINSFVGGRTSYIELTPRVGGGGLSIGGAWTIDVWVLLPLPNNGERWNTLTRAKTNDHQVITSNRRELGACCATRGPRAQPKHRIAV